MPRNNQNPYSLLEGLDLQNAPMLASVGEQALASGAVTPEEALKNLSPIIKLLTKDQKKNPLLKAKKADQAKALEEFKFDAKAPAVAMTTDQAAAAMDAKRQAAETGTVNTPSPGDPAVFEKKVVAAPSVMAPAPVKMGSGLSMENAAKADLEDQSLNKGGSKSTMQQMLTMTPEQFDELYATASRSPAFQDQMRGVQNMEDLLRMSAEAPVDYLTGPLAGLLQTEFGRNVGAFMQGRPAQTPIEQRQALLSGLSKIQDDKRDITKQIIDAIKSQKAGSMTEVLYNDWLRKQTEGIEQTTKAGASDPAKSLPKGPSAASLRPRLFDAFQKHTKDDREALSNAQNAIKTLGSGSKVGIEAFKNFMARASGEKGPLTESDIARFSGDPSIAARLDRVFTKWGDGTLTDADSADMKLLAQKYVEYRRDLLKKSTDYFVDQVAPGAYQTSSKEARSLLEPRGGFGLPESKIDNKKPGSGGAPKAAPGSYDGSGPLPANATTEQKQMRANYLRTKKTQAGGN